MAGLEFFVLVTLMFHGSNGVIVTMDKNMTLLEVQKAIYQLDQEVQLKNDQVQELKDLMKKLNGTFYKEVVKATSLEARVIQLEAELQNTTQMLLETCANNSVTINNNYLDIKNQILSVRDSVKNSVSMTKSLNASIQQSLASLASDVTVAMNTASNSSLAIENLSTMISTPEDKNETHFSYRTLEGGNKTIDQTDDGHGRLHFVGKISASGVNSYDKNTGMFTAPVDGVYWFTSTLSADAVDYLSCYITRNNKDYLVEIHMSANNDKSSASASVAVDLKAGDTVEVGKCTGHAEIDSYKSSFSGFLITEL